MAYQSLSDLVRSKSSNQGYRARSIVDFAESPYGANQKLFPVQRFFLKLLNGEEFDNTVADIRIEHPIEASGVYTLTEVDYYELLYNTNRINLSPDEYRVAQILEYLLPWGRRGTKSTTISIGIAYELDELIKIPNPQRYFGIAENDRISITYVGLGQINAEKLFAKSAKIISGVRSLAMHIPEKPTNSRLKIFTRQDLDDDKRDDRGIKIHSLELAAHPNSPGLRGDNNITYVMEEFAHFNVGSKSTKEQPLDQEIHDALSPSAAAFRHPSYERQAELHAMDPNYPEPSHELAGKSYGKGYILSSPLRNKGKFYDLCMTALEQGLESNKLMVNVPTWEINPLVSKSYLVAKFKDGPATFDREFAALFTKSGESWIKKLGMFYRAFDTRLDAEQQVGDPNFLYFLGLDFASGNDGCAAALVKYDPNHIDLLPNPELPEPKYSDGLGGNYGSAPPELYRYRTPEDDQVQNYVPERARYVVEHASALYPAEGRTLSLDEIFDWVTTIYGGYRIFAGFFDQWAGEFIQQEFIKRPALKNVFKVNITETLNSNIAKTFMGVMYNDTLRMPFDAMVEDQLLGLKEEVRAKGIIKVEVPASEGHDDLYDAIARAVYLAKAYHEKNKAVLEMLLGEDLATQAENKVLVRVGSSRSTFNSTATANKIRQSLGVPGAGVRGSMRRRG